MKIKKSIAFEEYLKAKTRVLKKYGSYKVNEVFKGGVDNNTIIVHIQRK
jgi:hypothetical protein